jgi:hydrogenase-4 component E
VNTMDFLTDLALLFVILINLTMLASSRIVTCIRLVAIQGMSLGLLPFFLTEQGQNLFVTRRLIIIAVVTFVVKGFILPRMLTRALRLADVRHEIEPLIGHSASVLIGVMLLALSFWMGSRFQLPELARSDTVLPISGGAEHQPQPKTPAPGGATTAEPGKRHLSNLVIPAALSTILIGMFLIVIRKKALNQVIGYLLMENGIYIFGVALAYDEPILIELGVLLDVFVAVFVMGITIFHISRTFDHIDTTLLTNLKD